MKKINVKLILWIVFWIIAGVFVYTAYNVLIGFTI